MNVARLTRRLAVWLAVAGLAAAVPAHADDIPVAVAANFKAPMQALAADFERRSGHRILSSFGATGTLYAQIRNGAPFEVLLSADAETPARLVADRAAVAGSPFTYARGTLLLWSPRPGVVDRDGAILRRGAFDRIAIANPKLSPYGAAAEATLRALGLYETLRPRFITGESIAQAHQFVASGNVPLGFVARSQVLREGAVSGSFWLIPAQLYPPIRQDAVLLERGRHRAAARALLQYLQSEPARNLIRAHGYDT